MNDENKTKEQLMQELARLRQRVAKFECLETERKQAERESATIIETTSDGFWIIDLKGRFINVNDSYCRITGYTREELLTKSIADVEAIEKPEEVAHHIKRIIEQGYDHFETRHRRKDGTMVDLEISVAYLDVDGGQMFVFVRDITERKRMEENLEKERQEFRFIVDSSPIIVFYKDLKGRFVRVNKAFAKALNTPEEKLLGKTVFDLYSAEIAQGMTNDDQQVLKSRRPKINIIEQYESASGIRWVQTDKVPAFDQNGILIGLIGFAQDITERRQAEEELQRSEDKYRALFETMSQGVVYQDVEGHIISANHTAERLLGMTLDQMMGRESIDPRWKAIHKDGSDFPGDEHPAIVALRTGKKLRNVIMGVLRPDVNKNVWINISAIPQFKQGKPYQVYTTFEDITERKRMEDELQESHEQLRSLAWHLQSVREEERADIARGIHDELGQALTALKMDVFWLSKRLPQEQKILLEKTRVMSRLIDSAVKTVKKIATELRPGILDDFGLIAAIEWQAEEFHKRSGIKCTVTSVTEPHLDREHNTALFRIFQETLTNVARHTSATRVTVNLACQGEKMIMRIRDNGKGITQEQLSSSNSFGIIGMRERVRTLGGHISIRGIPGKGTTVTVTIRLVQNGEAQ